MSAPVVEALGLTKRYGSTAALSDGIWLAPGSYFRPDDAPSAWFRFNVPHSTDDALWRFIERVGRG